MYFKIVNYFGLIMYEVSTQVCCRSMNLVNASLRASQAPKHLGTQMARQQGLMDGSSAS